MTPQLARARCTMVLAEAAAAGKLPMFHTVPGPGQYPVVITRSDDAEIAATMVVDQPILAQLAARFAQEAAAPGFAGLLVDREHLSELPAGDSTAAAWVMGAEVRPDGLWTAWQLTDLGEQLINNKRFKFRSPVLDMEQVAGTDNQWRPVRLVSVALTNVPHFKQLAPASLNRESGAATGAPTMTLVERIRARLGKPDAKEDEVFDLLDAALKAGETAITDKATLTARVKDLEKADIDRKADEFVKEHGPKVADAAKLRARFVADPVGTREAFALLKAPATAPVARALGRDGQSVQTPDQRDGDGAGSADITKQRKTAIATIKARDNCSHAQAVIRAQKENPSLWKTE